MPDVPMPRLSDSMEEGTVAAWLVADGGAVVVGQEIVEIETDKATMAYAAAAEGTLRIVAAVGETLPLGAPIAQIVDPGEEPEGPSSTAGPGQDAAASPSAAEAPDHERPPTVAAHGPRVPASPVARRIAREHGVALDEVPGTGPQGRVTKQDVLAVLEEAPSSSAPAGAPRPPGPPATTPDLGGREDEVRDPTRIELLVARRMTQSRSEVPEFTVSVAVDMAAALDFRSALKRAAAGDDDVVLPSVNDLIVKACGAALREHRKVNSAWTDGRITTFGRVNVGVAVATDDGGLVVPVVSDVDRRSLGDLAATARELTARARSGSARPDDFAGGTFTVSNLGMLGVSSFSAIITPGQGAILSVGAAEQRFVAVDGQPVLRPVATLTLNSDHRVIYGADAAAFLNHVRRLLEHPAGLAL